MNHFYPSNDNQQPPQEEQKEDSSSAAARQRPLPQQPLPERRCNDPQHDAYKNSHDIDNQKLKQALQEAIRLRNRLAGTVNDTALLVLLRSVLPQCLRRLDQVSVALMASDNSNSDKNSIQLLRKQTQGHLIGSLAHAIQRIRNIPDYNNKEEQAASHTEWMQCVCQELVSYYNTNQQQPEQSSSSLQLLESSISRTMVISLLSVGVPRALDVTPCCFPAFLQFVNERYHHLLTVAASTITTVTVDKNTESNNESSKTVLLSAQTQLNGASWLLLNAWARHAGMRALQHHQVDYKQSNDTNNNEAPPWNNKKHCIQSADATSVQIVTQNGSGVMDLLLDVILFWPATTMATATTTRPVVGMAALRDEPVDVVVDNSTGLSMGGLTRMNHHRRRDAGYNGDEIYWRHLKYACTQFALGSPSSTIAATPFSPTRDNTDKGLLRGDRALLLAVLAAAGPNSMHGRLGNDLITQKVGPHAFDEMHQLVLLGLQDNDTAVISWSLAINLLILVLGDQVASKILEQHPDARCVWEPLLGPRPTSTNLPSYYRRSPLSAQLSNRVIRFLCYNINVKGALQILNNDDGDSKYSNTAAAVALFLDLAVQTQDPRRPSIFWGMDLLTPFYRQVSEDATVYSTKTKEFLCSKLIATAMACLKCVPPSKTALVEADPIDRDREPLPLGVPEEYSNRDDLHGLLQRHRDLQRKRTLLSYEAIETRKRAYRMIADSLGGLTGVNQQDDPLSIPITLFECIAFEDPSMAPMVADSLKVIMTAFNKAYRDSRRRGGAEQESILAPLLPSLICAAASFTAEARDIAREWSHHILADFDGKMADIISNYLTQSEVKNGEYLKLPLAPLHTSNGFSFIDPEIASDRNKMLVAILERVKHLSGALSISSEVSLGLLQEFDFSISKALEHFQRDRNATIKQIGMCHRVGVVSPAVAEADPLCQICLNEFRSTQGAKNFALPCGHQFCSACWKHYLDARISDHSRRGFRVCCPHHTCNEALSIFEAERLDRCCGESLCKELISLFVENDAYYTFCTKVGCNAIYFKQEKDCRNAVTCIKCTQEFCFDCGGLPHQPASCKDFARWTELFGSSSFWIRKNAKPCPSCAVPIEKSGGCNHIRCHNCGHNFCWICLTFLRSHMEPHVCNRYDGIGNVDENAEEERSIFFVDRYQAHEEAENVAKQRATFIMDHQQVIESGLWYAGQSNVSLFTSTFGLLVQARSCLKYSYVVAWSHTDDLVRKRFQDQQAILEVSTEKLTQLAMSHLDNVYRQQGALGIESIFGSIAFHSKIVHECMARLLDPLK